MIRPHSNTAQGFTIVEILIVIAIGGVIILLVFLSIPPLVRANHNSQRKQDVALILQSVSQYELRNSGAVPAYCDGLGSQTPGVYTRCYVTGEFMQYTGTKLNYYDQNSIGFYPEGKFSTPVSPDAIMTRFSGNGATAVMVYNYLRCATPTTVTRDSAGYHDVAAVYAVETGTSAYQVQCASL